MDRLPGISRPDGPKTGRRRFVWRRRWTAMLVVVALTMAGLTLFAAANYVHVEVRLIIWEGEARVSWIGLGCLALGFVLGIVMARSFE